MKVQESIQRFEAVNHDITEQDDRYRLQGRQSPDREL